MSRSKVAELKDVGASLSDPLSPDFRSDHYPFAYVSRVSLLYNTALSEKLKLVGLDQPSWRILMVLADQSPCNISRIIESTALKQSTLTRMIQRMRRDGLIETRSRDEDQRIVDVYVTDAGRAATEKARPLASNVFKRGVSGLSHDELMKLMGLLARIETAFRVA